MTTTPIAGTLTHDEVAQLLHWSSATLYRARAEGRVPEPDATLGPRSVRWRATTISRWIEGGCLPPRSAISVRKQKEAAARPKKPVVIPKRKRQKEEVAP